MISWPIILDIILIGLVSILIYIFKNTTPAYLKKKGENIAQKQDIQELTRLVKSVEHSFDRLIQSQINFDIEERNAIISIHNSVYEFFVFLSDMTLDNTNLESEVDIRIYHQRYRKLQDKLFAEKSKSLLFINDKDFDKNFRNIITVIEDNFGIPFNQYYLQLQELITNYPNEHFKSDPDYQVHLAIIQQTYIDKISNNLSNATEEVSNFTKYLKLYISSKTNPDDLN